MKLSIVIVNYNVKYFLEQSLRSVYRSNFHYDYEVIVVDNDSDDGSMEMVEKSFPDVIRIRNSENLGFSKANNQGIRIARGQYILLLNPDTILSENTLKIAVDRMDENKRIGGLGVRMIDGGGHFLPESKRGLPTPFVAFCKAFGLSRLFPRSRTFNYYHLGHIPQNRSSEVDVLSGAFMMIRRSVIDEIGGLDESFFMYGEDIDLSYRIQKAGYINWYEAETSIVHFKGESTKRGSLNYVRVFYKAMIIFANKHFVGKGAMYISIFYKLAVVFRAALALGYSVSKRIVPIVADGAIIFLGLQYITGIWARYYFGDPDYYSTVPLVSHHIIYTLVWLSTLYLGGAYDRYFKLKNLWRSLLLGTIILLVAFSLVSSDWRPSRAIVVLGAIWSVLAL
ncbi:MAG: glycosyltransferase, partial [Saprospiraceae bacterium]|nr:glycosyltransferase [Saprospiraceae bacterium]